MKRIEKEKLKVWLKDSENLILLGVILLSVIVRIFLLNEAAGQTLWWDEAEYGASAKYVANIIPDYNLNPQRPFLFIGLVGLLYKIGFSEVFVKFLVVVLPSVLLSVFVYLLGKELFNKKTGLIAAFLTALSWTFVFWSSRLQPDFFSMCFQMLSILFMWRYWKGGIKKNIIFGAIFASLGFQFKVSGMLVPAIIFIFSLLRERVDLIKKKDYWLFLGVFLLTLLPQFIYSYIYFGNLTALFTQSNYANVILDERPLGWMTLYFVYSFTESVIFLFFIIGLIFSLKFLFYIDVILKDRSKMMDGYFFSVLSFMVVVCFYIFYIQGTIEDRWLFLMIPFMFFITSEGLKATYSYVKHYQKQIAVLIVILVLAYGGYAQYTHASSLVEAKKDTYSQVKAASLWMKENSAPSDSVLSISYTQTAYYSERATYTYSDWGEAEFMEFILDKRPKFILVSIFEPHHPSWSLEQPRYADGSGEIMIPFANSSLAFNANGQMVSYDFKPSVKRGNVEFVYAYPQSGEVTGAFVYEIRYT